MDAGRALDGPVVSVSTVARVCEAKLPGRGYALSTDQALAVEKVATSGRALDVLVGPAGTGKSTTMAGLRAAWEACQGRGSVIALAPSAAAAEVLGYELGIPAENTAKWLSEWRRVPSLVAQRERLVRGFAELQVSGSARASRLKNALDALDEAVDARRLHAGQLVIVDEASLAGTFALDELVSAARSAGAKVLLVGDWAQLSAVEAGGAFGLLFSDRGDLVPELTEVQRFEAPWEKAESIELRLGHERALDAYESNGRVVVGEREAVLDALYRAWEADVDAGKTSLMIAPDSATVAELNARARACRVARGQVAEAGLTVADGQVAGAGDEIVTRENNRLLATGKRWVKNGDRWLVAAANEDGSMAVRRLDGKGEVVLPAGYLADHGELAYPTTAYRAQDRTVGTAHACVSPITTRQVLYVSATRGRNTNHLYVDTCFDPDPATSHEGMDAPQCPRDVLVAVLARQDSEVSAHEAMRCAESEAEDFAVLASEYLTIAQEAQHERFDELLDYCGLSPAERAAVASSEAYGPLLAALRDAEAHGLDVTAALPKLSAARSFGDADDVAGALHARVERWAAAAGKREEARTNLVAGLIPRALGISDPDTARALQERDEARTACQGAGRAGAARRGCVGSPARPAAPGKREAWLRSLSTVAAFRQRWEVNSDSRPLGPDSVVTSVEGLGHRRRAQAAIARALGLANDPAPKPIGATSPATATVVEEGTLL